MDQKGHYFQSLTLTVGPAESSSAHARSSSSSQPVQQQLGRERHSNMADIVTKAGLLQF
jgi:hypothetical protein